MLWPDYEPERAINIFHVTCTYIRNTLSANGFTDILLRERNCYRVDAHKLNCDYCDFMAVADNIHIETPDIQALEAASRLFAAPYFDNMPYEWAYAKKVWLKNRFKALQFRLADEYCRQNNYKKACIVIDKVLEHDPLDEEAVEKQILVMLLAGNTVMAKKTYRDYVGRLQNELDLSPSPRLQKLITY